jgi:hypothetical protein
MMDELDMRVSIRVSRDLHKRLERVAAAEQRDLSNLLRRLLTLGLDAIEGDQPKPKKRAATKTP